MENIICPPIMSSWQIGVPSPATSQRSSRRRWWRMEAWSRRTFCAAGMKRLPASNALGRIRYTVNWPGLRHPPRRVLQRVAGAEQLGHMRDE